MSEYKTVIGLSFGNTSSSIAFEKDGKVEIIANQDGDRSIPSIISYIGSDEYHGIQAKNQLVRNPRNTVTNFRDFIGEKYTDIDPTYCHASAHPVEHNGQTCFLLHKSSEEGAEPEYVSINQIVTRHLDRLRESAVDFIGKPVDGAVITVPTDFSEAKRIELVKIANEANLKVLQVINEPTAALLAHVSAKGASMPEDKIYLVADFGGTRSDGAVIASRGGIFTILTALHDYELGGNKLDDALADYVAKDFQKQHDVDAQKEPRSIAKLKAESEDAKKTLSNTTSSNFAIESLAGGIDYHTTVNRLRFELSARTIFNKFVEFVEKLIKKSELDVLDINEVLLVGGTSFIPKIAGSLQQIFDEEKTTIVAPSTDSKAINPNELSARGAAIQASLIAGFEDAEVKESLQAVVTVAPHLTTPVGLQIEGEHKFISVIDIDTPLPIRRTMTFSATTENVLISVYELKNEIEVTTVTPPPKEEQQKDDDESDWSDEEDEERQVRSKVAKAGKKLAEAGLKGVSQGSKVEVILSITKELKMQIAAREIKTGGVAVRGVTQAAIVA